MSFLRPASYTLGLAALVAVLVAGCDPGPAPVAMSGTVTFDGQAVENGQLYVVPNKTKGNDGQSINASITNGKYEIRPEDRPMPSGEVIVKIDVVVDGGIYVYETQTELPKGIGSKDFAVKKSETKLVPPLAAPGLPGGGGGNGKEKGKGRDRDRKKKDTTDDDKAKPKEGAKTDEKAKDEKPEEKKPEEKKDA